jgi:membrane protein insertase Oxa1/YidC/SpoIIIJ
LRLFFVLLCPLLRVTYFFGHSFFFIVGEPDSYYEQEVRSAINSFFYSELLSTISENVTMSMVWLRNSVNLSSVFTLLIVCSLACSVSLTMYWCVKVKTLIAEAMIRTKITYV